MEYNDDEIVQYRNVRARRRSGVVVDAEGFESEARDGEEDW